eukprot:51503-Amphidinium_carterae.2
MSAGVNVVWMKAHQSDRDAEEGRVQRNRMADTAANNGTHAHVPFESSEECEHVFVEVVLVMETNSLLLLLRWGRISALLSMRPTPFVWIVTEPVGVYTGRNNINYHALKGRACRSLMGKKRTKLEPGLLQCRALRELWRSSRPVLARLLPFTEWQKQIE